VATLIDVTHCETFHRLSHSPGVLVHDHGSTGVRAGIPPYLVAVVTGADTVEAEVRELVRRRGLDPFTDKTAMRRLVDEVVHDYDERTLTSSLPPLPDPRSAARAVYDSVAGFGPLQRHLDDPSVEEIWINERLSWGSSEGGQFRSRRGVDPHPRGPATAPSWSRFPNRLEPPVRPDAVQGSAPLALRSRCGTRVSRPRSCRRPVCRR
jgi:pilus assembly protein CpaF